jgi:putative ABC transport system permease protein
MSGLLKDLKFAALTLIKQPLFSLMIVGMLALGIAGNTAIFSVFNGLFLRPLPFPDSEQLMNLDETAPKWNLQYTGIAYPDFYAWREENRSFEAMAVFQTRSYNLFLKEEARRIQAARVTHDLASVLRMDPVLGRNFTVDEDQSGGPKVAMLGYGLWQDQFGGLTSVLGEKLLLNSEPYAVVGVLPSEAVFIGDADLWIPLATNVNEGSQSYYLSGLGRLKSGVTPAQAQENLTQIHKNMIEARPNNEVTSPILQPVLNRYLGDVRPGITVLLAAVGVVLLIACGNIAGLMLARSASRTKEMGIRIAMGAARRRLVQQLLTESFVLSAVGAFLGTLLGSWLLTAFAAAMPEQIPRWIALDLDVRFWLFTLLVTMGAATVTGLAPALQAARTDVNDALKTTSTRASQSTHKRRGFRALVVSEIAMALLLLITAGLLITGFRELQKVDPGFRPTNVLTYGVALQSARYDEAEQRTAFLEQHLERLQGLPGVERAAAISNPPLVGHEGYFFEVEGAPPIATDEENPVVLNRAVLPGYFRAMGVTLLSGRVFEETDVRDGANPVVIVNETFAKAFFPDEDALGRRIRYWTSDGPWMTIVGVTRDVKHYGLDTEMRPGVYMPYPQLPRRGMAIVLKTTVDPFGLVPAAREIVREIDAEIPLFNVKTMSQRLDESLWTRRAASWLLLVFAAVALVLAMAGVYGVISYSVSQRTQEISIRMALGASPGQVLGRVMRQGLVLLGIGVALGLAGAFMVARILSSLLFGVSPADIGVYTAVTLLLVGIAFVANLIPARRAAALDPIEKLRAE